MSKALTIVLLLLVSYCAIGQVVGRVDKKTKEFSIAPDQKANYSVIGYQLPSPVTKHLICFSSNENMVREESGKCLLGAYFDTDRMKQGDKIVYLGNYGQFAKMNYVTNSGKKILFYISKSCFVIK
ncbi:MAG TPA: hypothetical protein VHD83_21250 [Puia sp.]|nr:hypothetical protein [Puia sp.]